MKFKAAILVAKNKLVVEEIENKPLESGQCLVQLKQMSICGAQLLELNLEKGNEKFLPHLLGHEGFGVVVEVAPDVTRIKPGDHCVVHWRKGDGIESNFPKYIYKGNTISGGKNTTLSEYSVVSENRVTKVADDSPPETCALLGCCLSTAMSVIINQAKVGVGNKVLVLGAGGLGLALSYSAGLLGADVTAIDRVDKSNLLSHIRQSNYLDDIDLNQRYDAIVDTTGNEGLIERAIPTLNDEGKFIFLTSTKQPLTLRTNQMFSSEGKSFIFTQGGGFKPSVDLFRYLRILRDDKFDHNLIVTHSFRLDDISSAFDCLRSGQAGRILINI